MGRTAVTAPPADTVVHHDRDRDLDLGLQWGLPVEVEQEASPVATDSSGASDPPVESEESDSERRFRMWKEKNDVTTPKQQFVPTTHYVETNLDEYNLVIGNRYFYPNCPTQDKMVTLVENYLRGGVYVSWKGSGVKKPALASRLG